MSKLILFYVFLFFVLNCLHIRRTKMGKRQSLKWTKMAMRMGEWNERVGTWQIFKPVIDLRQNEKVNILQFFFYSQWSWKSFAWEKWKVQKKKEKHLKHSTFDLLSFTLRFVSQFSTILEIQYFLVMCNQLVFEIFSFLT